LTGSDQAAEATPEKQLAEYLQHINTPDFDPTAMTLEKACTMPEYKQLRPLFQRIFCTPATSAPVERVFSQSGLMIRPHRARMSDTLLETLVYLKCNVNVV